MRSREDFDKMCKALIQHTVGVVGYLDVIYAFNIKLTLKIKTQTTYIERTFVLPAISSDLGCFDDDWVDFKFSDVFNMNYDIRCKEAARVELVEVDTGTILGKVCFQTTIPFHPENLDNNGNTKGGPESV